MKQILTYLVITLLISACETLPVIESDRGLERVRVEETTTSSESTTKKEENASLALVIGNSQYEYRPLANTTNDAEDMASVLKLRGFDVTLKTNLKYGEMKQAIRQFGEHLADNRGSVGMFYFAGHGVQVKGENYLIPINNDHINDEFDIQNSAILVNEVVQRMEESQNGLNLVVLDACRDNPFKGINLSRSLSRGLARTQISADGMLIAFATSPNATASDGFGGEQNGLYTQYLLEAIKLPNLRVEDAFKQVRQAVKNVSNGSQVPWYNASLSGDFCFGGCNKTQAEVEKERLFIEEARRDRDRQTEPKQEKFRVFGGF